MGPLLLGATQAAPLSVTLEGVEARGGTVYVSVQTEDQFMGEASIASEEIPSPRAGAHVVSFDLPQGRYAVSVWHDDDANGSFDMGPGGMPLDGWAISGPPLMGMPTFEGTAIETGEGGIETTLRMTYGR
ncbi:DUF2141 domain-containing protein [Parvularcula dongshanensis]|uniref:Uncharacterized protein (DUF2141 family) n=1 Tax=Parvularcula dongshanensis TaxID=1173995 RepID=A0A840I530_9PROT|nr:DUF2141 domain-containing protein [Parvularcula dongshanensis]MBB4659482.1 uncharacterized protein (DUF2141 family) [Parvularcula dongshanensis]